jgi:hypothetical protein
MLSFTNIAKVAKCSGAVVSHGNQKHILFVDQLHRKTFSATSMCMG